MYLVIGQHTKYQIHDIRTDSHFLGWVHDNNVDVVRYHNGRFERMVILTEAPDYNQKLLRFVHEWREYKVEIL